MYTLFPPERLWVQECKVELDDSTARRLLEVWLKGFKGYWPISVYQLRTSSHIHYIAVSQWTVFVSWVEINYPTQNLKVIRHWGICPVFVLGNSVQMRWKAEYVNSHEKSFRREFNIIPYWEFNIIQNNSFHYILILFSFQILILLMSCFCKGPGWEWRWSLAAWGAPVCSL